MSLTRGAADVLAALAAARIPVAVVSSGARAYIEACLARWGLGDAFACVVAGDDPAPAAHKPDPAPYLYACGALGVRPADCVVVEDSPSGVEAALAAGAAVVAVRNAALATRPDLEAACAVVVDDLRDDAAAAFFLAAPGGDDPPVR